MRPKPDYCTHEHPMIAWRRDLLGIVYVDTICGKQVESERANKIIGEGWRKTHGMINIFSWEALR